MQQHAFTAPYVLAVRSAHYLLGWENPAKSPTVANSFPTVALFLVFLSCASVQEQSRAGNFGLGKAFMLYIWF